MHNIYSIYCQQWGEGETIVLFMAVIFLVFSAIFVSIKDLKVLKRPVVRQAQSSILSKFKMDGTAIY